MSVQYSVLYFACEENHKKPKEQDEVVVAINLTGKKGNKLSMQHQVNGIIVHLSMKFECQTKPEESLDKNSKGDHLSAIGISRTRDRCMRLIQ